MKTSDFCNKWNELHGKNGYFQRIDPKHPLDFFIGISPNGYEELVLITLEEPAKLISSKALDVEKAIRKDKKWATQIYSVEKENQDVLLNFADKYPDTITEENIDTILNKRQNLK